MRRAQRPPKGAENSIDLSIELFLVHIKKKDIERDLENGISFGSEKSNSMNLLVAMGLLDQGLCVRWGKIGIRPAGQFSMEKNVFLVRIAKSVILDNGAPFPNQPATCSPGDEAIDNRNRATETSGLGLITC